MIDKIRFSPFRRTANSAAKTPDMIQPVDPALVPLTSSKPAAARNVSIVHPEPAQAYRLKARLLTRGHRSIQIFFMPESVLDLITQGHLPDVVMVHDPVGAGGASGSEFARRLRHDYGYRGLIISTSPDHASQAPEALRLHGFSGHLQHYLEPAPTR